VALTEFRKEAIQFRTGKRKGRNLRV
jgi:hypothetical protein